MFRQSYLSWFASNCSYKKSISKSVNWYSWYMIFKWKIDKRKHFLTESRPTTKLRKYNFRLIYVYSLLFSGFKAYLKRNLQLSVAIQFALYNVKQLSLFAGNSDIRRNYIIIMIVVEKCCPSLIFQVIKW